MAKMANGDFMNELVRWRKRHKKTQSNMADLLQLDGPRTYQRYEKGERPMPAPVVERMRVLTKNEIGGRIMNEIRIGWMRENCGFPSEAEILEGFQALLVAE